MKQDCTFFRFLRPSSTVFRYTFNKLIKFALQLTEYVDYTSQKFGIKILKNTRATRKVCILNGQPSFMYIYQMTGNLTIILGFCTGTYLVLNK